MNRRNVLILFSVGVVFGQAAYANGFVDAIVKQLKRQGFIELRVENTWLGRVRIVGHTAEGTREIIVNPNSGEILRDLWSPVQKGLSLEAPLVGGQGGNTSGGDDDNAGSDDHSGSDDNGDDHGDGKDD